MTGWGSDRVAYIMETDDRDDYCEYCLKLKEDCECDKEERDD